MSVEELPDWLPEEYDPDDPLHERLPIMNDIEGGIELWAGDEDGLVEVLHQPLYLDENGRGSYTLRTGTESGFDPTWSYEVVVPDPENGDPFVRSVNPDQEHDAYMATRRAILRQSDGVDVRIYGVDHERLPGVDGDSA